MRGKKSGTDEEEYASNIVTAVLDANIKHAIVIPFFFLSITFLFFASRATALYGGIVDAYK